MKSMSRPIQPERTSGKSVLFLDQFATLGGGQRLLIDVIHTLKDEGWSCELALPGPGEVADQSGVPCIWAKLPEMGAGAKGVGDLARLALASRKIARMIRERSPDLVYCNGPRMLLAAALSGKPTVAAVHLIHGGAEKRLMARLFRRKSIKRVTFCSHLAMRPFEPLEKGIVVENWVSPYLLTAPSSRDEARLKLGVTGFAVGVLGRISPFKGQEALCKALRGFSGTLFVAGDTDHEQGSLEDLKVRYPDVRFLGKVADPVQFLDAMDVLVVPSQWEEPFGLVAVEGMARGLPVIVTDSGALPSLGCAGVVPKSLEGIHEAIARFRDPGEWKKESVRARAVVEERFKPEAKLRLIGRIAAEALQPPSPDAK